MSLVWLCHGCLEDQAGSVWDHFDRATGEAVCQKCKGGTNAKSIENTGAAAVDNGNQRDILSDSLPELLQIPNDLI